MTESDLITAALALPKCARWQTTIDRTLIKVVASETGTSGIVRRATVCLDARIDDNGCVRVEYGLYDEAPKLRTAGAATQPPQTTWHMSLRADVTIAEALTMIRMAIAHAEMRLSEVA